MLEVPGEALREMETYAKEGYPREVCGFLLGSDGDVRRVERVRPGRNLETERKDRYALDPLDFIRVDREAREQDLEILGFYHSHPDHPPQPSAYDRERAWPWYSYIILSTTSRGVQGVRSWRLEGKEMRQEELQLINVGLVKRS